MSAAGLGRSCGSAQKSRILHVRGSSRQRCIDHSTPQGSGCLICHSGDAMESLAGTTWRVVEVRAFDGAGRKLQPLGPHPIGLVIFEAERMLGAITDGQVSLPPDSPPRFFLAYTGTYRFDGTELVTQADDASRPELVVDQIRRIHFESPTRMVMIPVSGVPGQSGIEVVWERIG